MSTNRTDRNKQPKIEDTEDTVSDQSADDNFSKRRVLRHSYLSIQNLIRGI